MLKSMPTYSLLLALCFSMLSPLAYDFAAPPKIVFGWGRRRELVGTLGRLGHRALVLCGLPAAVPRTCWAKPARSSPPTKSTSHSWKRSFTSRRSRTSIAWPSRCEATDRAEGVFSWPLAAARPSTWPRPRPSLPLTGKALRSPITWKASAAA